MSKPTLAILILLVSLSISCSKQNIQSGQNSGTGGAPSPGTTQPRNSVDVVKASSRETIGKPGEEVEATVQLNIDKGYHVNANPPTFPYLKATNLDIPAVPGVTVSFIVYPTAITKTFQFAEKPLAVYEGVTDLKVRLKIDRSTKPGTINLPGKLSVQACDDQVCYAPGTLSVSIPLSVK